MVAARIAEPDWVNVRPVAKDWSKSAESLEVSSKLGKASGDCYDSE